MSESRVAAVKLQYAAAATSSLSGEHPGVEAVARAFGYSSEELAAIPAEANLGLSCGNPTAMASLRPGEVVVDLGCGGGLDVFLAAAKVGPTGRAIGIDMTEEMIARAKANAARGKDGRPITNVEFHLARIDALPLGDGSADCVISNCVVNLAPDKSRVFREMFRVLKSGGRVAISDIALKKPLPEELAADLMAYVGCIAGALPIGEYQSGLLAAGFTAVEVNDTGADLNAYALVEDQAGCCTPPATSTTTATKSASGTGCCSAPSLVALGESPDKVSSAPSEALHARLVDLLTRYNVNDYAASVRVMAVKPG